MNGFGKLGDSLGMGSCDAPVATISDGDSTAKESGRYMPRTITPYRGAITESRWGGGPPFLTMTRKERPFTNLFDTLFT